MNMIDARLYSKVDMIGRLHVVRTHIYLPFTFPLSLSLSLLGGRRGGR